LLASLGSKGKNRNSLACLRNAGSYSAESYCICTYWLLFGRRVLKFPGRGWNGGKGGWRKKRGRKEEEEGKEEGRRRRRRRRRRFIQS